MHLCTLKTLYICAFCYKYFQYFKGKIFFIFSQRFAISVALPSFLKALTLEALLWHFLQSKFALDPSLASLHLRWTSSFCHLSWWIFSVNREFGAGNSCLSRVIVFILLSSGLHCFLWEFTVILVLTSLYVACHSL